MPTSEHRNVATDRYVLQARRLQGPLSAPSRNDEATVTADDWSEICRERRALTATGWHTWIYERIRRIPAASFDGRPPAAHDLTLLAEWDRDGNERRAPVTTEPRRRSRQSG